MEDLEKIALAKLDTYKSIIERQIPKTPLNSDSSGRDYSELVRRAAMELLIFYHRSEKDPEDLLKGTLEFARNTNPHLDWRTYNEKNCQVVISCMTKVASFVLDEGIIAYLDTL